MKVIQFIAILLISGNIFTQTTTATTTTTTTTPSTTTPSTSTPTTTSDTTKTPATTNPNGTSTCGIIAKNIQPANIGECTGDKNIPNYTCCLLTYKNNGNTVNQCDATVTAGLVGDYKGIVKKIIEDTFKLTYVDYQCASSYLSVSILIFFLAAFLF